ncbi:MAG TPA: carboxypeptidase-like regulatory domain-containing protein, partial [Pyrinomonadaceae bacterium]|nr:carboxypeptidase-like regulatory domain-containing protein [Pyrinomonadaceae bacterium]
MKKVFMFVLAMTLAMFATSAMAQSSTTGSIEGMVSDPNGAAIKGATITVTSPNLISPQTATSGDDGRYQIPALPPGTYKVSVDASGFGKYEKDGVSVNLGRTSSVDPQLSLGTATATVTVTGGAAVDVAANTTGTNVSTEQFSNFPTQRTVQGLYTIAPTVTRSGLRDATGRDRDPSVGGSSGPENNYILDGVNTTDPAFGGSGANLPFEFVQEVEIKT